MKVYCNSCNKPTTHRQKLEDIVCNKCDRCNLPVFLQRVGDGCIKVGTRLVWIEWTDDGLGKATHNDPQLGFSLCLDPYIIKSEFDGLPPTSGYHWMTSVLTEIIEDTSSKDYRMIKFKTKNSEYILHVTTLNL